GLLPIYTELEQPQMPAPSSLRDLETAGSDARARGVVLWLDQVDAQLKPADFRRRLRHAAGAHLADILELVLERLLACPDPGAEQVQKVDEACFDYFSLHAPPEYLERCATTAEIETVLAAILVHAPAGGSGAAGLEHLTA